MSKFAMWFYEREPLTISLHLAKFWGHSKFGIADVKKLICHATSEDHMIKN